MKAAASYERVFRIACPALAGAFASVYPHYVAKVEKKGRTKEELHTVIHWLTGYTDKGLAKVIADKTDFETFFAKAPRMHPNAHLITGMIPQSGTGPAATGSKRSRTRSCVRSATWTSWWMNWRRARRWRASCGSSSALRLP